MHTKRRLISIFRSVRFAALLARPSSRSLRERNKCTQTHTSLPFARSLVGASLLPVSLAGAQAQLANDTGLAGSADFGAKWPLQTSIIIIIVVVIGRPPVGWPASSKLALANSTANWNPFRRRWRLNPFTCFTWS